MKKFIIGLLVVAVLGVGGYYAIRLSLLAKKHQSKKLGKQRSKKQKNQKKPAKPSKPATIAMLIIGWQSQQKSRAKRMSLCCIQRLTHKKMKIHLP